MYSMMFDDNGDSVTISKCSSHFLLLIFLQYISRSIILDFVIDCLLK